MTRKTALRLSALAVIVAVFAGALIAPKVAAAKDYSMSDVVISAQLQSDGSMQVTEARTFKFSGSYNGVYWDLDHTGHDLRIDAVGIVPLSSAGSQEATQAGATPMTQSDAAIDGTTHYTITDQGAGTTRLTMYNPVTDSSVRYVITYTITDAIELHTDAAMLYWKGIGDGWQKPVDRVRITIHPPAGSSITPDDILVWAHGPLTGKVSREAGGAALLTLDMLPAQTFVEARVLYPPEVFPAALMQDGLIKQQVLDEEQQWADQANAARKRARADQIGGIAGMAFGVLVLLLIGGILVVTWFRYGREYKDPKPFEGEYWREDPAPDLSPALVGAIWRMDKVGPLDFSATILQLLNDKVITMTQTQVSEQRFFGLMSDKVETVIYFQFDKSAAAGLGRIEQKAVELLDLVAGASGLGANQPAGSFTIDDLKAYAKQNPEDYRGAYEDWIAVVKGQAENIYIETRFGMRRRSHEGNRLQYYYQGLYRYLKDFSRMQEKPVASVVLWNRYLVLATVFGIADEVAANLKVVLPEVVNDPAFGTSFTWFYLGDLGNLSSQSFNESFAGAITQAQVAASPQSSGGGFGGGFSGGGFGGGGGGGFGGGGGGAF